MKTSKPILFRFLFTTFLLIWGTCIQASAQQTGRIQGTIVSQDDGEPIAGASVSIEQTLTGTASDSNGRFILESLTPGRVVLRIQSLGFETVHREVLITAGSTSQLDVSLAIEPIGLEGIAVTALRPTLEYVDDLSANRVREVHASDAGDLVRVMPGLDAGRRGAIGLDPNVRGLVETEVGAYIDGVRFFPAGPLRMDSQISHFDPTSIRRLEVVKGPYALTWGAGNMGAIRVERYNADYSGSPLSGYIQSGYNANVESFENATAVSGRSGAISYWAHGALREGNDYDDGNGDPVQADYESKEARARLGYVFPSGGVFSVAGGFNRQDDIDYPGRLLNAENFDAVDASVRYEQHVATGLVRHVDFNLYWNGVEHKMNNNEKPTAVSGEFPNGNPRPPLVITVESESKNLGGRASVKLSPAEGIEYIIGSDFYSANRDAIRPLFANVMGNLVVPPFYTSDKIWPDVTITDVGAFTNVSKKLDQITLTATGRADFVAVSANRASEAYLANVGVANIRELDDAETNISGALTVSRPIDANWSVAAGVGSVVRTADALERYSDRIPASKAQTSAEFLGNPTLKPERSTQFDLWLDGVFETAQISLSGFYRTISDYITLSESELSPLLPLSPPTVYEYVNGDATFYGVEALASVRPNRRVEVSAGASYLYGQDDTLDEPALGVSPAKVNLSARYNFNFLGSFLQGVVRTASKQTRVAETRGEVETGGYTTIDLRAGISISRNISILAGANNVLDEFYVNHLNARNPFNQARLPEPGRVLFATIRAGI